MNEGNYWSKEMMKNTEGSETIGKNKKKTKKVRTKKNL